MKFRTDFVTNSSSSSFSVAVGLVAKNGDDYSFRMEAPQADEGDYGTINVKQRILDAAGKTRNINDLVETLMNSVQYEDNDDEVEYEFISDPDKDRMEFVGLDSREPFRKKVRQSGISLDDVQKVYIEKSYMSWGEFIQEEALALYGERYNKQCVSGSIDISELTELDLETGKTARYIDGMRIRDERVRIAKPGDWNYDSGEQKNMRINLLWHTQNLDRDADIQFAGKTFVISTNEKKEYEAVSEVIKNAGGTVESEVDAQTDYLVLMLGTCGYYVDDAYRVRYQGGHIKIVSGDMVEAAAGR